MANFWLCLSVILSSSVLFSSADTLVGGSEKIDPSRSDVQIAASYAVSVYNEKSDNEYLFKVLKVLSAESQVVAGVIYRMDVEIGLTQCKKGSTDNGASCALVDTPGQTATFLCKFAVLEQPWLIEKWSDENSILESSCKPAGQ
ncbi:cystatin-2-like [Microcaecilia unicolor]|uniref:Cystatin-2-like n=1 Tax=Microcaecilia unicolor TaxID=1415580 RepID=A0A6P7XK11_9AMPH|nr:cystatin-2-like [Microcaecilia unicolor]